ncbi:hypothetical protein LINPERHAP2_LOCUS22675 [Linum perenne]
MFGPSTEVDFTGMSEEQVETDIPNTDVDSDDKIESIDLNDVPTSAEGEIMWGLVSKGMQDAAGSSLVPKSKDTLADNGAMVIEIVAKTIQII